MRFLSLLLLAASGMPGFSVAAPDWVPRAFEGGSVTALARRADTLYAGTSGGGIFLSGDGGAVWQPLLKPGTHLETGMVVTALAATSRNLVVATSVAGYCYSFAQRRWTTLKHPAFANSPFKARKLVADGDRVAALAEGSTYFLSLDGGDTWGSRTVSHVAREAVTDIAISGDALLAATTGRVIFSADAGEAWTEVLGEASARIVGSQEGKVWVATPQKLWRNTWAGLSAAITASTPNAWTPVDLAGIPANRREVGAVAESGGRVWVAGGSAVYVSQDAAGNFQAVSFPTAEDPGRILALSPVGNGIAAGSAVGGILLLPPAGPAAASNRGLYNRTIQALARHGGRLHALVQDRGLFSSPDSGRTWEGPQAGLRVDTRPGVLFHAFSALHLGQGTGIHRVGDGGKTLVRLGSLPGAGHLVAAAQHKDLLFAAVATEGLYVSRDSGLTWSRPNPDTGWNMTGVTMKDIVSNGKAMFAVGANQFRSQLYRSLDDGGSWHGVEAWRTMDNQDTHSLHAMGDTVFAGTTWDLYATADHGETWVRREVFAFTSSVVDRIESDGDFMLAASRNSGAAISKDRGRTWERLAYFSTHLTAGISLGDAYLFGTDGLSLLAYYPDGAPPESIARKPRAAAGGRADRLLFRLGRDGGREAATGGWVYDIRGNLRGVRGKEPSRPAQGVYILVPEAER